MYSLQEQLSTLCVRTKRYNLVCYGQKHWNWYALLFGAVPAYNIFAAYRHSESEICVADAETELVSASSDKTLVIWKKSGSQVLR